MSVRWLCVISGFMHRDSVVAVQMAIDPKVGRIPREHLTFRAPESGKRILFYISVTLFVFMLKSIVLMRGGALYGRLAGPPVYDDVSYFVDALQRMRIFLDQGVSGLVSNLLHAPPHAPYSTLASLLAFLFGGPYLAGPYLMNGVAMAMLAAMVFVLFRVSVLTTWCVALILIATRWFDNAVTMFHPDLVAGFATAIMAAVFIWQSEIIQGWRRAVVFGVAAGIILLIKPVAFAMAISLWSASFVYGALVAYREEKSWRPIGTRLLIGVLAVLVIAGPYFAHEIRHILGYIYQGFVLERETWSHRLADSEHSGFYLSAAKESFAGWFAFAGVGASAIVLTAALGRDWTTALRFTGLILVTLFAYAVPASVEVKHYLYGGVFYGSIAVCLIITVHFWTDRLQAFGFVGRPTRVHRLRMAVLVLLGAIAVAGLSDKQGRQYPTSFPRSAIQAEYDNVYGVLSDLYRERQELSKGSAAALDVYFPCPAPIAPHAYLFRGLVDGIDISLARNDVAKDPKATLEEVVVEAGQAAVIVVPDDAALKWIYPYPVNKLIPGLRAWLAQNAKFTRVRTIRSAQGNAEIFADVSLAHDIAPSSVK
ncbi:MAG TPA: hypothetical protein VH249_03515 [Xanthobacteraceae bacterium]|jgi:hypothetical protein|nr:hypothetical protein [Xanthobacteraceae bacterium]